MSEMGYKEGTTMTMPENEKPDPKLLVVGLGASMVGKTELTTKFRYPDGVSVDLVIPESSLILTDLGQTRAWLSTRKVPFNQIEFEEKLLFHGVRRSESGSGLALETDFEANPQSLEAAVVRLGQACVGVVEFFMATDSVIPAVVAMLKAEDEKCVAYLRSGTDPDKRIQQEHYSESLNWVINAIESREWDSHPRKQ
jgi:hypothetical protein